METTPLKERKMLSIEKVIELLGGCGLFQRLIISMFMFMSPPRLFQVVFMIFGASSPKWKCVGNSTNCTMNGTFSHIDDHRCYMPRTEWEYSVPRENSILAEFDLVCDRAWMRHLLNSIIFVGWGVGAVLLGYVADNYGRRSVLYLSQVMVITIGFITSFLYSVPVVILCRFLIGIFIPAGMVQSFVLLSEYTTTKYRPFVSIGVFVSFTVSAAVFALKAYYIPNWRTLSIFCTAPYIVTALSYFFVPESIRWIRLKGKEELLIKTLRRVAYWNRKELPNDLSIKPLPRNIESQATSIIDVFRTRKLAIIGVVLGYAWMANGMVFYSLVFATSDLPGSIYLNFALLALIGIPGNGLAMYLPFRFGRKKTVIGSMFFAGAFCIIIPFVPRVARLVCACFGRLFIGISFSGIYLWSVEVYPTNIRSNAMGYLQVTARVGAVAAPWVANGLFIVHKAAPYLVMGVVAFLSVVLLLPVPETKGKAMAETIEADGKSDVEEEVMSGENDEMVDQQESLTKEI